MKMFMVSIKLASFFILSWMKHFLNVFYIKEITSLCGIIQSAFHSQPPLP